MKKATITFVLQFTIIAFVALMGASTANAANRTWLPTAGGAWTTTTNWSPSGTPGATDTIIISGDQSAAITAVPSVSIAGLTINGNCIFQAAANGNTVTVTGTSFTVASGKTFTVGNSSGYMNFTLSATGTGTVAGAVTLNANTSTDRTFTNSGDLTITSAGVINGSNRSVFTLSAGATLRIGSTAGITTSGATGNVQVAGTRTYTAGANYEYNGTAAQVTGNGLTQNTPASLTISNSAGVTLSGNTTISGVVTISPGATLDASSMTLALSGAGTPLVVNGIITPSTSTVSYTGTGSINVTGGITYNNLTINNSGGTFTATEGIVVNGNLTITAGTFDLSTFTANRASFGGTLTVAGTLRLGGTVGGQTGSNFPINFSTLTMTSGNVNYDNSTGGQTVFSTPYNNLTMGNSSGTQTAGANLSVGGVLTTTAGGTLDMGTFTLSVTGSPSNSGTLLTQNTSASPIPAGKTWAGTVDYDAASGGQTVMAGTYATLTLENTSGTQTASGNIASTTLNNGNANSTLNMVTFTLGVSGTPNNSGTIRTQSTSASSLTTGKSWGGTVKYDATAGGQPVVAGIYDNLTLGNTSGTQTASNAITVNGTLVTTSGGTFTMVTYQLLGTLSTVTNGGTLQTQNTSSTPIPTGKTWGGTVQYNVTAGGQTVAAGTYNNLTLSNTSGTQAASGDLTVNGTLTTTASGILNMGTNQLLGTPTTVTNNGTIQTQSTSSTPLPTGKTWAGTVNYNAATGGQTVAPGTYGVLTLGNTSGTQTAGGNLTVTTLNNNTNAADVLDMVTNTLAATTVNNTGTILTQNTSATPMPTGKTWGGIVQYNGVAQTVANGTYNNLTLSGSGAKTTTGVTVSVKLSMEGTATVSVAPTYSAGATLQYNTATGRTVGAEWITPFAATGGVIIANTGTITLDVAKVFNASIPLTISSGATLATGNFQLTFGGNFVNNGGTFTAGSSPIVIANTMVTQSIDGFTTTGLVSMTKTAGTATFQDSVNGGALTINGTGGTLSLGTGLTHQINGAVTFTSGTLNGGSSTLGLTGNFTGTGGAFTQGTGTVTFNGSSLQTINWNVAITFNNLIINNAAGVTNNHAAGGTSVAGTVTMTLGTFTLTTPFTVNNLATIVLNGGTLAAGTNLTMSTTSAITVRGGSMTGTPQGAGVYNVAYTGNSATTGSELGGSGLNNVTVNLTSGQTLSLGTAIIVDGTLAVSAGSTLNTGTNYAVTLYGSFTNSGTFIANGSPITIAGTSTTPSIAGFSTTGALFFTRTGSTATFTGNVTAGSLTMNGSLGTLNLGTGLTHQISGAVTLTAGTLNGGSSVLQVSGAWTGAATFTANTGVVNFNAAGPQTLPTTATVFHDLVLSGGAKTFGPIASITGNLTLSGSATATTGAALAIGGNLSVGDGTTFTIGAFTLSVAGTTTVGGGTSGTLAFSSATNPGKTFSGLVTINAGANWTESAAITPAFSNGITNNGSFTAGSGGHIFQTNAQSLTGTFSIPSVTVTSVTLTNNNTLTVGTALSGTGGLTNAATGTLNLGGSSGITTLTATAAGNMVNYTDAAQIVHSNNYYHLNFSGSGAKTLQTGTTVISGNLTLSGTATTTTVVGLTISGNLNIGDSTTFTAAGFALTVTGATTVGAGISGNLTISSATGTKIFAGLVTINAGGTWTNTAAISPVTFRGGITNHGTFNAGTGVYTFDTNAQALNGTLAIPNVTVTGVTLTNNDSLTVNTALSGTGGLTQGVDSYIEIKGTSGITTLTATASGNTVQYSGAAQTVHSNNYYTLQLYNNTKTLQTGTTTIGGNLYIGGNPASVLTVAGLTINGDLTIGSGPTFTVAGFPLTVNGKTTVGDGISGILTISSAAGTKAFNGDVIVSSGATWNNTAANVALTLPGNISNAGAFNAGSGVYTLSGTGKTISGTLSIPNVAVTGTYTNSGSLTVGAALTGTGGLTNGAGGVLNLSGTYTIATLTATANGNTVNYSGAAQSLLLIDYFDLALSGSGVKSFPAALTIGGNLSISGTAVADLGTSPANSSCNSLQLGGTFQASGPWGSTVSGATNQNATYFGSTATAILNAANFMINWTGAINAVWSTAGNWNGGVPTSSSDVVISNVTNKPVIAAPAVCRSITIANGSSLTISGSNTLTVSGDWTNNGTFTANTSAVIMDGSTSNMNGSATTSFYDLTINKGAYTTTVTNTSRAFAVTNNLLVSNGNLTLSAIDADYQLKNVTASYTSGTNYGTVTHNAAWDGNNKAVIITGNLAIDGMWNPAVRSHVRIHAPSSSSTQYVRTGDNFSTSTLSIVSFEIQASAICYLSGTLKSNQEVYAMSGGNTGSFHLNGYHASFPTLLNVAGTFYADGGILDVGAGGLGISGTVTCSGSSTLNNSGNWANNGTFTAGNSTVNLNGGGQAIQGSAATTFNNLTLSGSGLKTLSPVPTVNGILSMEGTTTASAQPAYGANSTLQYKGTAAQAAGLEFPPTFSGTGGVIIDNTNGVTLNASKTISNGLVLANGILTTTPSYTISAQSAARTLGHVNGQLALPVATGAPTKDFYVGDANTYAPVTVAFGSVTTAGNLTVSTTAGDHPSINTSGVDPLHSLNRYWTLTNAGIVFTNYGATFTFVAGDVDPGTNTADFVVNKYDGAAWSEPTTGAANPISIQATGLTSFSSFAAGVSVIHHYVVTASSPQTAGAPFLTTVTAQNVLNSTVTSDNSTVVTMSGTGGVHFDSDGNGTFGDNTKTLTAGTFTISTVDSVAGDITITATDGTSKTGDRSGLVINAAAAFHLVYGQQPVTTVAGVPIPITVQLKDAFNNNVATADVPVDIALSTGIGTLSGTTSRVTNGSGLASFNDLSIDLVGTKVLTASTGVLASVIRGSLSGSPSDVAKALTGVGRGAKHTDLLQMKPFDVAGGTTQTDAVSSAISNPFDITPGAVATTTSVITASDTSIPANGSSSTRINVRLKDAFGNNVTSSGGTVALFTTLATLGSVVDSGNGGYGASLTAGLTVGAATITGTINGSPMTDNATVTLRENTIVAASPLLDTAQVPTPFSINFTITDVTNLRGASVQFYFYNAILRYDSTKFGTFIPNPFPFAAVRRGDTNDTLTVDISSLSGSATGSGVLFTVHFTPLAEGTTPLSIIAVRLRNELNSPILASTTSGMVSVLPPVLVSTKIFLEGPYDAGTHLMNTLLGPSLPLSQPYSVAPWSYSGTESVASGFFASHPTIVDWVLVELRTGTGAETKVATRAAFVKNTGEVVNIDGTGLVVFGGPAMSYYIVIRHRNHLAVMSAAAVPLSASSTLYDFTTGTDKYYGTDAAALSGGKSGMYAGDYSADGFVDGSDFVGPDNDVFQGGYLQSDLNLDSFVDGSDFVAPDNNLFKGTNVPGVGGVPMRGKDAGAKQGIKRNNIQHQ